MVRGASDAASPTSPNKCTHVAREQTLAVHVVGGAHGPVASHLHVVHASQVGSQPLFTELPRRGLLEENTEAGSSNYLATWHT